MKNIDYQLIHSFQWIVFMLNSLKDLSILVETENEQGEEYLASLPKTTHVHPL
jgi:hypothetical protein